MNLKLNNTHENIFDSEWLRTVHFKCNTSAKSVTPVQNIVILDYDRQNDNEQFCGPMISCNAITKTLYGHSEKVSSNAKKMASRNIFRHFSGRIFHVCIVFLVQFEINLHL